MTPWLLRSRQRHDRRRHRTLRFRLETEDEPLELRVEEVSTELVGFHFSEGMWPSPALVDHSVRGRHDAGSMLAAYAVDIHRLVLRIIDNCHERIELRPCRCDMTAHRD